MSRKILLADDSITIQKVVELTFSDSDFDVVSVGNGEQALRKAREMRPDIALLDVIMPEKNGYEVCQIFKQDPDLRRIPVLLLTGTFESFDRERADAAGADGYLTKPFESQMLISKVEELLAASPRQVTPLERAGRMEVFTEGQIMRVEAPAPEQPAAVPQPAAAPTPDALDAEMAVPDEPLGAAAPDPEPDTWSEEAHPQEVSFPAAEAAPAPEAAAAFREWAGPQAAQRPAGEDLPMEVASGFTEEEVGSGPPPAAQPGDEAIDDEPAVPAAPAWQAPVHTPAAPETYEQTFDMPDDSEAISLAAQPQTAQPQTGTMYTGEVPAVTSAPAGAVTPEMIDEIARRVTERLSDQVIREVAWEVIPDLAELLIKQRIRELERGGGSQG